MHALEIPAAVGGDGDVRRQRSFRSRGCYHVEIQKRESPAWFNLTGFWVTGTECLHALTLKVLESGFAGEPLRRAGSECSRASPASADAPGQSTARPGSSSPARADHSVRAGGGSGRTAAEPGNTLPDAGARRSSHVRDC